MASSRGQAAYMGDMTMTTRAKTTAASTAGSFAGHEHTTPDASLTPAPHEPTPRQLAALGLGPDSPSVYRDTVDAERGRRPLRPYLPLQPADDDEFFDAPVGSVLTVRRDPASTEVEQFTCTGDYEWVDTRAGAQVSAGELWGSLFSEEDGVMASTLLTPPEGVLYSDRTHYVARARVDQPMMPATAVAVFKKSGGKANVIARHVYGDIERNISGVKVAGYDQDVVVAFQGKDIVVGGVSTHQVFPAGASQAFFRDGDIVLRHEPEQGRSVELTLRR